MPITRTRVHAATCTALFGCALAMAACSAPGPGNTEAVGSLKAALEQDPSVKVRGRAARALGRIGSADVVPSLLRAYEQQELILDDVVASLRDLGVDPKSLQQDYVTKRPPTEDTWVNRLRERIAGFTPLQITRGVLGFALFTSMGAGSYVLVKRRRWRLAAKSGIRMFTFVTIVSAVGYYWILTVPPPTAPASIEAAMIVTIELAREKGDASLVPWLTELLNSPDRSVEIKWRAAQALGAIGDARARDALTAALSAAPQWKIRLYAAWALGNLYTKPNNRERGLNETAQEEAALRRLTELIIRYPNAGVAYLLRSRAHTALGEYARARADLDRALILTPRLKTDVIADRGYVMSLQGEPEKALEEFNVVLSIDNRHTLALFRRGLVFSSMSKWAEAAADFTAVRQVDPTLSEALVLRAAAYEQLGRTAEAAVDYEEYLKGENSTLDAEVVRNWLDDLKGGVSGRRFPFDTSPELPVWRGAESPAFLLTEPIKAK